MLTYPTILFYILLWREYFQYSCFIMKNIIQTLIWHLTLFSFSRLQSHPLYIESSQTKFTQHTTSDIITSKEAMKSHLSDSSSAVGLIMKAFGVYSTFDWKQNYQLVLHSKQLQPHVSGGSPFIVDRLAK